VVYIIHQQEGESLPEVKIYFWMISLAFVGRPLELEVSTANYRKPLPQPGKMAKIQRSRCLEECIIWVKGTLFEVTESEPCYYANNSYDST
jgi:hypothetical protein